MAGECVYTYKSTYTYTYTHTHIHIFFLHEHIVFELHQSFILNLIPIHQRILNRKYIMVPKKHQAAQLSSTLIQIRNVTLAPNQHVCMISEGSCDTEDTEWLLKFQFCHYRNKLHLKYIKIETAILNWNICFPQYY